MTRFSSQRSSLAVAFSVFSMVALLGLWPSVSATQSGGVSFRGRAIGAKTSLLTTVKVRIADTGPLPSSGGQLNADLLSAKIPGILTAGVVHASTIGQGDRVHSEASVAQSTITFEGVTVTASLLASRAEAVCTPGGPTVEGSSEILDLKINGSPVVVTGAPNQTIVAVGTGGKLVTIVINEQTSDADDITVNALHLSVASGTITDVVIAQSIAGVTCLGTPVCTINQEFVSGYGFFLEGGVRADFSFTAGRKPNGALVGGLSFSRVGGPTVKSTCIYNYEVVDANTRLFDTTVCINNQCGFTARVTVDDNLNPDGTGSDTFKIELSTGATYQGVLAAGNIQIHEPCQ